MTMKNKDEVSGAVDELPKLPQPGIGFPWRINGNDGVAYCAGFTAEQMREYALAARALLSHPAAQQPSETAIWNAAIEAAAKVLGDFADAETNSYRSRDVAEVLEGRVQSLLRPAAQEAEKPQTEQIPSDLTFDGYHDSDEHYGKTILDLVQSRSEAASDDMQEGDIFYVSAVWVQPQEWRVVRSGSQFEVERISPPAEEAAREQPAQSNCGACPDDFGKSAYCTTCPEQPAKGDK